MRCLHRELIPVKQSERIPGRWGGDVEVPRLSMRGQLVLNVLWFALNAQSAALLPIVIPAQIVLFISSSQVGSAQQVYFLSWLLIGASIISLFMPPIIGTLSDQTPSGFGRRRPYIGIGGLLVVLSTPLLVDAGSIMIFLVGLSLLLVGKSILTPAYQSLVPDRVPEDQRCEASGDIGTMQLLGKVVGLGLQAVSLGGLFQGAGDGGMCGNAVYEPGCAGIRDLPWPSDDLALAVRGVVWVGVWGIYECGLGPVH